MSDTWQPNPGHMPVAADVPVLVHLEMFETPSTIDLPAGKFKWLLGTPGSIKAWRRP